MLKSHGKKAKVALSNEQEWTLAERAAERGYGIDKGQIRIADDFDAPLPELENLFYKSLLQSSSRKKGKKGRSSTI
jgi:hypothetical protein